MPQQPSDTPKQNKPKIGLSLKWALFFLIGILAMSFFMERQNSWKTISYSEFLDSLEKNNVEKVSIRKDSVVGEFKIPVDKNKRFMSYKAEDPSLISRIREAKIPFEFVPESSFWGPLLSWLILFVPLIFFWSWLSRDKNNPFSRASLFSMGKSKARVYAEREIPTRFADVAGVDEAKSELQEIVKFLKDPNQFNRLGGRIPKGILLVGPPGTGKTLIARAVAGEASVPFFTINGSEFVELFVGLGAARVRDLFAEARNHAPCIIFIDELDALGKARGLSIVSGGANDEKEQTLNQLLAEIDGFDPSKGVILLAATNRPEILDPALLRSGRFDRQILIDRPDRKGRKEILAVHVQKIIIAKDLDLDDVAAITTGFSGADLANLVNEAAIIATRRQAQQVELQDFHAALERIVAGLERKTRILSEDEKLRIAFHEMGHATINFALKCNAVVHKVSIVPRGLSALGYTIQRPTEDRYLLRRVDLENKIAILLGGKSSELLFLKDFSTGAADDLDKATEIARSMITQFGMNESLGSIVYEPNRSVFLPTENRISKNYSEKIASEIDQEVRFLIDKIGHHTAQILKQHETFIRKGVALLLEKETLNTADLMQLWDQSLATKSKEKFAAV